MQRSEDIWERRDVRIVIVSFEPAELLSGLAEPFPDPFQFLSDPERQLYRLYAVDRQAGWWQRYSPATLRVYARALLRGSLPRGPRRPGPGRADLRQLGGDFVLDAHGRILLAHRSRTSADRPSMDAIRSALAEVR